MKIHTVETELIHSGGQTDRDRHNEASSRFSQILRNGLKAVTKAKMPRQ